MPNVRPLQISPLLGQYVQYIQLVENDHTDALPFVTFGYPEATSELLIVLAGSFTLSYRNHQYQISESCCFTFIEEPSKITVSEKFRFIRIVFKPLGVLPLVRLSGLAAKELISKPVIGVSEFLDSSSCQLISIISSSTSIPTVETLINEMLNSKLLHDRSMLDSLGSLNHTATSVDRLCDLLCCTPRTLQRWFKNEIGVSPKYFLRLLRFKHTLEQLANFSPAHPIAVANTLGYYDQNHLIKEVQNFTHTTPGKLSFDHYLPTQLPSG
ncbi:MAG: helix-turn-helix domain-containing protein [Cyclobacteriaceae bacterium]